MKRAVSHKLAIKYPDGTDLYLIWSFTFLMLPVRSHDNYSIYTMHYETIENKSKGHKSGGNSLF